MDIKARPAKTKTADQFFADMYRDLRTWNRQIPESPERADPILRILLQLYSHQLANIDERIGHTWQVAVNSLIKSLAPEAGRWPVPAYTVMACEPSDPVVEVDPHSKFFYKEKREGGQTFFFSTQKTEKVVAAEVKHLLLRDGNALVDLKEGLDSPGAPSPDMTLSLSAEKPGQVYAAVEYEGPVSGLVGATIFLKGNRDVLRQLRWAHWFPGAAAGGFYDDAEFCPGLTTDIEDVMADNSGRTSDWGGLRTSSDLFKAIEDNWVVLPEKFAATWEVGPPEADLARLIDRSDLDLEAEDARYRWIRIDLPAGGNKQLLTHSLDARFNCFVAVNKNELVLFKHTGGNRLVEVELAEPIDTVLNIVSVADSNGEDYIPRHLVRSADSKHSYTMEERNGRLVLWFDFSSELELPPDALTITYTVTAGHAANGISEGRIADLYEKHPGISSVVNVTEVRGAIPAKTDDQVVAEVSARLRNRDRAMTFPEIATWAKTFDPRIRKAECKNGIERTDRGVRRCIVVTVTIGRDDVYSDEELDLIARRLERFLKSRAPINMHFNVETATR